MNPRVVHFYFAFFGTLFIAIDKGYKKRIFRTKFDDFLFN